MAGSENCPAQLDFRVREVPVQNKIQKTTLYINNKNELEILVFRGNENYQRNNLFRMNTYTPRKHKNSILRRQNANIIHKQCLDLVV